MPEHQQIQQSKKPDTSFQKQATYLSQTPVSNPYSIIQRARINPKSLTHADIMQLQRTIGNQAVGRLLSSIRSSSTAQQAPIQRQEIPEEEPLQGKMIETVQRQEIPEEEEPLQGKFESIQRQEIPEEEEPLQGKMAETIQRQEIPEEEELLQGKFEDKPEIAFPSCFAAPIVQRQEIPEEEEPLQGKVIGTVQRQEIPEEEEKPMQGKFESIQCQEIPKEEEPLQGKMAEAIQRQEIPEEEEPLQGKMIETVQRQEIPEEEEPLQGKFENKSEIACPSCFADPIVQRQEIPEEEEPLQGKMIGTVQRQEIPEEEEPLQTKRENNTGMPDNLKAGVESLSGIDMGDVRVHYNSDKPAEVGALAYTQGTDIHVAPGQEKNLPHEAWHVVQQKQGRVRPTVQMKMGMSINDDPVLEHEADEMGRTAAFMGHCSTPPQLSQNRAGLAEVNPRWNPNVDLGEKKTLISSSYETPVKQRSVIQKNGDPQLSLTRVADPKQIAEFQIASGPEIAFTGISSCIALIGKSGDQLIGAHIGLFMRDTYIPSIGVKSILNALSDLKGCNEVYLVGEISFWPLEVTTEIESTFSTQSIDKGSGNYSAKIVAGKILIQHNGKQIQLQ